MKVKDINEFVLIERLLQRLGPQPEIVGLGARVVQGAGDDCAVLQPAPGALSLHTTDTMVAGIHFLGSISAIDLGWKSLATNVSDIAAMGGVPALALITLAMPDSTNVEWLCEWYEGTAECAREYGVAVVGGDIVRTRRDLAVTISLYGEVEPDLRIARSGARPGDAILVTGTLGDSAAGLTALKLHEDRSPGWASPEALPNRLVRAHAHPIPRVREARAAAATGLVHAMIDLSDGLAGDIRHICKASGVGARLDASRIPISGDLIQMAERHPILTPLDWALVGGEDYELMLCVAEQDVDSVKSAIADAGGAPATRIGAMTGAEDGTVIVRQHGQTSPLSGGFTHF